MKVFFTKHKKPLFFAALVLVLNFIFTTAAVTEPQKTSEEIILNISTCSIPEGRVTARGIDVSFYQGDIDFEKVKDGGVDFVIIRAGATGFGTDEKFERYYSDALSAGIDIGCYYYSYSTDVDGAKRDALDLLEIIKGKTFSYPVFLDFEESALLSGERVSENTEMINAFCETIKQNGYYPGVYTSSSIYENFLQTDTLGSSWDFWIASYNDHTSESDEFASGFSMWQYSNLGSVSGIDGEVDLDVSYVNYPKIINEFNNKLLKYTNRQ